MIISRSSCRKNSLWSDWTSTNLWLHWRAIIPIKVLSPGILQSQQQSKDWKRRRIQ